MVEKLCGFPRSSSSPVWSAVQLHYVWLITTYAHSCAGNPEQRQSLSDDTPTLSHTPKCVHIQIGYNSC